MPVIVSQISPRSVVTTLSCGVVLLCAAFESQVYSGVELTSLEHLASDLQLIKLHLTHHLLSLSASAPPPCVCPAALHLDGLVFIFALTTSPLLGVIVKPGSVSPFFFFFASATTEFHVGSACILQTYIRRVIFQAHV